MKKLSLRLTSVVLLALGLAAMVGCNNNNQKPQNPSFAQLKQQLVDERDKFAATVASDEYKKLGTALDGTLKTCADIEAEYAAAKTAKKDEATLDGLSKKYAEAIKSVLAAGDALYVKIDGHRQKMEMIMMVLATTGDELTDAQVKEIEDIAKTTTPFFEPFSKAGRVVVPVKRELQKGIAARRAAGETITEAISSEENLKACHKVLEDKATPKAAPTK